MDENKVIMDAEETMETCEKMYADAISNVSPLPDLPVETVPETGSSFPWKPVVAGGLALLTLIGGGVTYAIHRKNKKNGGKKKGSGRFPWGKSEEDYEDDPLDCEYEEVEADYEDYEDPEESEK